MPVRLNQIIAIEKGLKTTTHERFTQVYQQLQKPALLSGLSRSYQPRDEEGEQLPSEHTRVQVRAEDTLQQVAGIHTELFDVTAAKELANCGARADVTVNGHTLLKDVPVTLLLFLEKQLVDLRTYIQKLPVLDPAESWHHDEAQACWATEPTGTIRTKKTPRTLVKAEATVQHPAQVEVFTEDVPVGTWRQVKFSGAMEAARVKVLLARVEELQKGVKFAREEANGLEATPVAIGKKIFDFLFA
jgi:hypothetical protein